MIERQILIGSLGLMLSLSPGAAQAGAFLFDFESPNTTDGNLFNDNAGSRAAGMVMDTTGTHGLTTRCAGSSLLGSNLDCYLFDYGGPTRAFGPSDTPAGWTNSDTQGLGEQGLTDGRRDPVTLESSPYALTFDVTVHSLELDLIDFSEQNGTGSLTLYDNSTSMSALAQVSFGAAGSGSVQRIGLYSSVGGTYAVLSYSRDVGTAIDNVTIGTPEPASLALLGAGLAGLGLARRRKR